MHSSRKKQSLFSISYDPMYQFSNLKSAAIATDFQANDSNASHSTHFRHHSKPSSNRQFQWKSKNRSNSKNHNHIYLESSNHSAQMHQNAPKVPADFDPFKVPSRSNTAKSHHRRSKKYSRRTKKTHPHKPELQIDLETLKRHEAAKIIQRSWRRYLKIKYQEEGKCLRHGATKVRTAKRLMRRIRHSKLYKIAKEPWIQNNHHKVYMKTHQCTC
ncbi:hypothetical protein K7432_002445 [Basidiobolus ranarum]|uniref:Uncharacterized protein n=1 Tax=Basidiobolus ranarum TaxID=34480 RepID=A0ABR2W7R3_9FUNG